MSDEQTADNGLSTFSLHAFDKGYQRPGFITRSKSVPEEARLDRHRRVRDTPFLGRPGSLERNE